MEVKIIQHDKYLEVLVWGNYTLEEAVDRFPGVISTCRLSGVPKVLIDYRKLQGDIAAIQKIIYAAEIVDIYNTHLASGGQKLKIAYLGSAPMVSTYEPSLEIAKTLGIPFKLFMNIKDAQEWLQI